MNEPELLTVAEVAKYLKMTQRTVREMIQRGELKAAKLGKAYRLRKSDVLSFFDNQIIKDIEDNQEFYGKDDEVTE